MTAFALGLLLFLVIYWTLIPFAARRAVLGAVSIAALAAYTPSSATLLLALTLATWGLVATRSGSSRRPWVAAAVLACLGVLAFHKWGHGPWHLLGVSYATLRLIHVAVESGRGRVRVASPLRLVEYALFPPAFLAGPIDRYPDFERNSDLSRLDLDAAFWGLRRVVVGLAKKVLLADPLGSAAAPVLDAFASASAGQAWRALLCYSLRIYLDFSAYCDVALGVARLFGYRLPENFDWPYLATDITTFWRRWHITLSGWLRDYVYLPVSIWLSRVRGLRPHPFLIASVSAVATMLVCGLWHGEGASFVLWGLGHGLLLVAHQAHRQWLIGRLSPEPRKRLLASPVYRLAATAVTFLAVSLLWVLFLYPPERAGAFYLKLWGY